LTLYDYNMSDNLILSMYLLFQYRGVYILSIMTKNYGIILEYDRWYYLSLQIEKQKIPLSVQFQNLMGKTVDSAAKIY
jgi:extradiol dioxygenase family protein